MLLPGCELAAARVGDCLEACLGNKCHLEVIIARGIAVSGCVQPLHITNRKLEVWYSVLVRIARGSYRPGAELLAGAVSGSADSAIVALLCPGAVWSLGHAQAVSTPGAPTVLSAGVVGGGRRRAARRFRAGVLGRTASELPRGDRSGKPWPGAEKTRVGRSATQHTPGWRDAGAAAGSG